MTTPNVFHVIKDPVHGAMQFTTTEDSWVKPLIDSPHFQRLRHIKQLGLGDYIFPGALHTRFNHSLGCAYVASQIATKIGLSEEERQLVMIACLLHDIGHGPFSHAFEGLFHDKLIKHEDWTPYFLKSYGESTFFSAYNQKNPRYHLTGEKFKIIANMIMHQPVEKTVLADIVSSQLDADRLDYLLRDSHFCGVRYGEFDLPWMLHCMTILNTKSGERLGITHKGIGVVEHYLMARRLMTRNIYHGQKKLAFEALLVEFLRALASNIQHQMYAACRETMLGKFLSAVNDFNRAILYEGQLPGLVKSTFLTQQFDHYKWLCDDDVFTLIRQIARLDNQDEPAVQIARRLTQRIMPKIIRLDEKNLNITREKFFSIKKRYAGDIAPWQLMFIETPHQAYTQEENPILVINENNEIKPINQYSLMINAMSDKLEHIAFLAIDKMIAEKKEIMQNIHDIFAESITV